MWLNSANFYHVITCLQIRAYSALTTWLRQVTSNISLFVSWDIIILLPNRRLLPLIIIIPLHWDPRHYKILNNRYTVFFFYFLFEFDQFFFNLWIYISLFLCGKWSTSKGDVVTLWGSFFSHLKLTHSSLINPVKVMWMSNSIIEDTGIAVFIIHRLFHEGKSFWVRLLILMKLALNFLLQNLPLYEFSFKSAAWLAAIQFLYVINLHRTWCSNLGHYL